MKTCPKCKIEKPETEFYKNRSKPDCLHYWCKSCSALDTKTRWEKRSPEQKLERSRSLRKPGDHEVRRVSHQKWRKNNPDKVKASHRKAYLSKSYGLTEADFAAMLVLQNNMCAICARVLRLAGEHSAVHIDHCHVSGNVRGILCRNCNTALGKFQDSEKVLASAIEYLRKNETIKNQKIEKTYDDRLLTTQNGESTNGTRGRNRGTDGRFYGRLSASAASACPDNRAAGGGP